MLRFARRKILHQAFDNRSQDAPSDIYTMGIDFNFPRRGGTALAAAVHGYNPARHLRDLYAIKGRAIRNPDVFDSQYSDSAGLGCFVVDL
jgi:hypothetical protein